MNKATSLAVIHGTDIKSTVNGLIVRHAKSGAMRLAVERKKEFRERLMRSKNPQTGHNYTATEANAAFDAYRAACIRDLNIQLGQKIANGEIQAESVGGDAFGNLRTVTLTKERQQVKDKVARAAQDLGASRGLDPKEILEFVNRRSKELAEEAAKNPTIEAETRSVATPTEGQPVATS